MRHFLPALGVLALSTAGFAQAPDGYVVVAESSALTKHNGLVFVDPDTKTFTRTRFREGRDWIGTHVLVALDPNDPKNIFAYAGFGIGGTPLQQYRMEGNRIASFGRASGPVWNTGPVGMHVSTVLPGSVLYTTYRLSPGLYSRSTTDGKDTKIVSIKDAWGIATAGGKVYVSTHRRGFPSKLFEVDLKNSSAKEVTLTANGSQSKVPAFQALSTAIGDVKLLVGDDDGVVWSLDPTNGAMSSMAIGSIRKGAIVAIARHPRKVAYVATRQGVWDWVRFYTRSEPLYAPTGKEQILDLDVSFRKAGALVYYGNQCPGAGGKEPYVAFGGYPTQGNSQFSFGIANAAANTPALGFLGFSRTTYNGVPLPMDLGAGMPGCSLQTSIVAVLNLFTDAQGKAPVAAPVPVNPALAGVHVTAQFAIADSKANAAGISTTEGVEIIIR